MKIRDKTVSKKVNLNKNVEVFRNLTFFCHEHAFEGRDTIVSSACLNLSVTEPFSLPITSEASKSDAAMNRPEILCRSQEFKDWNLSAKLINSILIP